ncbi:MAG TPA: glycosyltransferase family 4 protein [Candidatus Methylomirabilis sp.]|nr:glycosyltransferase family 4 protein [Candidatus Methylomirabilis sp.]
MSSSSRSSVDLAPRRPSSPLERRASLDASATYPGLKVALLTGGKDAHYVLGLLPELVARGVQVVVVGNAELVAAADIAGGRAEFHDLVGSLDPDDGPLAKAWRVLSYYGRLLAFAARTDAALFHVLWFRKFPLLERVLLTGYFKWLGKKLAFTAHNVDDRARDGRRGTLWNKLSLALFYRSVDHIFVHTHDMKIELVRQFGVFEGKVKVVPFGINDVIPVARLSRLEARRHLGLGTDEKVLLFFGNIAPYKGVEDLLRAVATLVREDSAVRLVLAGRVKDPSCESYWSELEDLIDTQELTRYVRKEIRYIPDEEAGVFFRATDVSVLPYRRVDQSGVVALSYAQGVPVIASDAGSLKTDVKEGETGFVFRAGDVLDLVGKIRRYFASELFNDLEARRSRIRTHGAEAFSWTRNADLTCAVYRGLLKV